MMLKIVADQAVAMFVLYCLTTAGLGMFLQECMKENMILERYKDWLLKHWENDHPCKKLLKPLGLCVYCQTFWINAIVYYSVFNKYDVWTIMSIGGVYFGIEIIRKIKA